MGYTIQEHRLMFSIWAAYRAAQAGSSKAKGAEFSEALKACGVIKYLDGYRGGAITPTAFSKLHKKWCDEVIGNIKRKAGKKVSFGIAAKLVAVFVKSYFILAGNENTPLAKVAHPPIDSILLEALDKKGLAKTYKWSKLTDSQYYDLIDELRQKHLKKGALFWCIEESWTLPKSKAKSSKK